MLEAGATASVFLVSLFLLGLELVVARVRRRAVYRAGQVVSDLGCGLLHYLTLLQVAPAVVLGAALGLQVGAPGAMFPPGAALVALTFTTSAGLLEARRWAVPLEVGRVASIAVGIVLLHGGDALALR